MNAVAHHFARDRRRSLIWAIGIILVLLLAAGGAVAGSALAGPGGPGGPGGPDGSGASSGEAATLNAALRSNGTSTGSNGTSASSNGTATASTPAGKAHAGARAVARLRRFGGMYGQVAFRGKNGTTRTLAFERGVVTSAGDDLVVKAANGTTWTWQYTAGTVVRKGGSKVSRSELSSGAHVLLAGPVVSGARDARLVFIAGARHPAPGPAPAPSPSASAGGSTSAS
jgi:hypothetical protein